MSSLSNNSIAQYERPIHRTIIFSLILTLLIPSYICYLFIFYNYIRLPLVRKSTQNRILLVLLIVFFIQVYVKDYMRSLFYILLYCVFLIGFIRYSLPSVLSVQWYSSHLQWHILSSLVSTYNNIKCYCLASYGISIN